MRRRASNDPTTQDALDHILYDDHARLERMFTEVIAAFDSGDREEAATLWSDFDRALSEHMRIEETLVLPYFEKVEPDEAALLRRDHARFREALLELGVGVDLHETRAAAVAAFVDQLRRHAARENALLYRWAQRSLRGEPRRQLRARLAQLFRSSARGTTSPRERTSA